MKVRHLWLGIVLLCMFGLIARAEITRTTAYGNGADTYVANDISSQSPDGNFGTEVRVRFRYNNNNRCKIAYLRFDISQVTGDMSGAYMTFQTTYMKSGGKTVTVYGVTDESMDNWGETTITFNNSPWFKPADPGKYNLDTTKTIQLGTFQTSNQAAPQILTTSPSSLDLTNFLASDTNGLVTFILIGADDETELATKENTTYQHPTLIMPKASLGKAVNPVPADEAYANRMLLTQLQWDLLAGVGKCEVYFGTEPNSIAMSKLAFTPAVTSVDIASFGYSMPLADGTYYWRVDCYDTDPDPNLFVGPYWSFTATSAPIFVSISPAYQAQFVGETADAITAVFSSNSPMNYTWYKSRDNANNTPDDDTIVGDDSDTLSLGTLAKSDAAWYYCAAANPGQARSSPARVSIKQQIAHYTFDGNADDSSGNTLNGTLVGEPNFAEGIIGQALSFDGTNDYVQLPADFDDFSPGITISVWARPAAATSWARFVDLGNGDNNDNIYLSRNGTTANLTYSHYRGTTSAGAVTAENALNLNEWQMYAAVMDQTGNVTLYRNGVPVQTGTIAQMPNILTRSSNFIGKSNWADDALYNGLLDDIQIWNYPLTADQIADMYAGGAGSFCRFPPQLDYNGNCVVDLADFAVFAQSWLECGIHPDCQ